MAEAARTAKPAAATTVRVAEPTATIARSPASGRRSTLLGSARIQPSLRVSQPSDASEIEAERVARTVVSMPDPAPQATHRGGTILHRAAAPAPAVAHETDAEVEADVRKAASGGAPLPLKTRQLLEPRFRANFSGVRIHTDAKAAGLSARLGAQAFTFGNHIFFAGGAYDTASQGGLELLAHELTHTIQQGETIQRKAADPAETRVAQRTERQASRLGISDVLDFFADAANAIPGYRMFTILIGVNPINMSAVEASAANILRAIVEFLPGGNIVTRVLDRYGIFDKVGGWIEGQLKSLGISGASIKAAITAFLDSLGWRDIFHLGSVWDRAKTIFTTPITKIISFAKSLFGEILRMVREAVLRPLAALAEGTAGYPLLKAVLGFDPVTGDAVPRTPETVIGGFMKLIGQDELWANIQKARAIPRAWAWFQKALKSLMALVKSIPGRFIGALKSLEIMDFVVLPSAFVKLGKVFVGFLADFGGWALGTVIDLLKIIVEVVAPDVMPYIAKAGAAFNKILKNPVGFVRTLVRAAMLGFQQFTGRFLTHLKASLIGWLTGAMGGAGLYIPAGFSLPEVFKFVLSVLGLTWANIRVKLVKATSENVVVALEEGFSLVKTLVKEGPAAAWQQILSSLNNLKEMVLDQVMSFVKSKVVEAAVTKLLSMLSPAGALIQAILAIFNTVMFFVERLKQIAAVARSFIDSIATIAAGNIGPAANRVEQTMAGLLTLVISFLARIAGLGKVSTAVVDIINKIRAPIDAGLGKAVTWIVEQAKKFGKLLVDKVTGKSNRTPQDIARDKQKAERELPGKIDALLAGEPSKLRVRAQLGIWKLQYKLTELKLTEAGEEGTFVAVINPTFNIGSKIKVSISDAEMIVIVNRICADTLKKSNILKRERTRQRTEEAGQNNNTDPTITSQGARTPLAFATRLRQHKTGTPYVTPFNPRLLMGKDKDGKDIEVRWRRTQGADWNRVIESQAGMRPYLGNNSIAQKLPKGQQSPKALEALQALGQGEQLPRKLRDPLAAGEMTALMLGQEVARSPENVAFGAMALDEMRAKNLDTVDMIKSLPAGPEGASATQRQILKDAKGGKDVAEIGQDKVDKAETKALVQDAKAAAAKGKDASARKAAEAKAAELRAKGGTYDEVLQRTITLMTAWIKTQLKSSSPITKTKKGFTNWLEKRIRQRVEQVIKDGN